MTLGEQYHVYPRAEWAQLRGDAPKQITPEELERLRSVNDRVTMADVADIYLPLVEYIRMRMQGFNDRLDRQARFLQTDRRHTPFIVGISGSVAVGKSTTARLLQLLLSRQMPDKKVQLLTTDGFLYPNAELKRRDLMSRKGFPESYDMARLTKFLVDVKADMTATAPLYSHQAYDVLAGETVTVAQPDLLIVEGINVLQLTPGSPIYYSDLYDLTLYVDAAETDIERWYLERFSTLLDRAVDNPHDYYYERARADRESVMAMARRVWRDVNLPNLREYILPTRERATVILHKEADHSINEVALRAF